MAELRKQIIRIIIHQRPDFAPILSKPLVPPTQKESATIRQIIASAMIDHVARRMTSIEIRDLDLPRNRIPYVTTSLNENTPAFIHRESFVLPVKLTDFVRFFVVLPYRTNIRTILSSKTSSRKTAGKCPFSLQCSIYLRGVTEVTKNWLPRLAGNGPMCVFSAPLETPQPFFDAEKDSVLCYETPRFGPHLWELPASVREFPKNDAAVFKWMARLLLEGKILPQVGILTSFYASSPAMINKPQIPVKAMTLIQALKKEGIVSKKTLLATWKRNASFLKAEISAWVLPRYQSAVQLIWPFVVRDEPVPDRILEELKRRFQWSVC